MAAVYRWPLSGFKRTFGEQAATGSYGSKVTILQLRKQPFLNDWLWEVATGWNGRRPACHFGIIDRAASSANQRGAVMGPEPFSDTILVLNEFL